MKKKIVALGAFSMAMAVILGALGAHALESLLSPERLDSFKTGVRYQAWHSLALIMVGFFGSQIMSLKNLKVLSSLFVFGILFFSISIYLLNLRDLLGIDSWKSFLGPVIPLGGLLLISGWVFLGLKALGKKKITE